MLAAELLKRQVPERSAVGRAAQLASASLSPRPLPLLVWTETSDGLCVALVTSDREFAHAVWILRERLRTQDCSSGVLLIPAASNIRPPRELLRELAGHGIRVHFSSEASRESLVTVASSILAEHSLLLRQC